MLFSRIPILQRRHACMLFHKFSEERGIDEIEAIGNLLDALVRMFQFVLDLFHGVLVDDGQGTFSADFLDNGGQVFGCVAELVGIVGYRAMASIILCHFLFADVRSQTIRQTEVEV